jgi:hypothetical protein
MEAATGIGTYLALSTAIHTLGPLTELSVALQELGQLSKLFWLNLMRSYMYQIGLRNQAQNVFTNSVGLT